LTKAGFDRLQTELSSLNAKRPLVVERLSVARSMGDLSENNDYQTAKEELAFLDGQIEELESLVQNAKITVSPASGEVGFGHSVTVKVNGSQTVFQIVGEWEANPAQKRISHASPLGQSLMGKKVGDQVEVEAPAGKILYTVVDIA